MPAGTGSAVIGFMRGRLAQASAHYKQKETLVLPLARAWSQAARDLLRCSDGVVKVLFPWVALGYPLYIPYTRVGASAV